MKTKAISKRRIWLRVQDDLEVWHCVDVNSRKKANPKVVAKVNEMELGPKEVTPLGGKLVYVWQAGNRKNIEWRSREAMQKAEDVLDGIR